MIFYIIVMIVLGLLGLAFVVGAASTETAIGPKLAAVIAIGAIAVVNLAMSATFVDEREVAIVTSAGKYDDTINEGGPALTAPWAKVERFDKTIQTVELLDISVSFTGGDDDPELQEIGGGKGLIDAQIQWQIDPTGPDGAEALWRGYRNFDRVSENLVNRAARDAVIDAANDFPAATAIISQNEISKKVEAALNESLAGFGIVVSKVSLPAIDLDSGTQAAVDKIFTTQQDIKRAENEQIRAQIDAETVALREAEGALSPAANQRFCLDVVNNWNVQKNGPLPATFDCALGAASTHDVIVNSTPSSIPTQ